MLITRIALGLLSWDSRRQALRKSRETSLGKWQFGLLWRFLFKSRSPLFVGVFGEMLENGLPPSPEPKEILDTTASGGGLTIAIYIYSPLIVNASSRCRARS